MQALGVRPASEEPKVSESIPEIVSMIEDLIQAGAAYATSRREMSTTGFAAIPSTASFPTAGSTRSAVALAILFPETRKMKPTLLFGSKTRSKPQVGKVPGGKGALDGTSSARPWRRSFSAPPLISTVVAGT